MFSRPVLFVGVLIAAFVVPYLVLDENLSQSLRKQYAQLTGSGASSAGSAPWSGLKLPDWGGLPPGGSGGDAGAPAPMQAALAAGGRSAAQSAAVAMEEAFRLEVTPQWVVSRFPRVTTVLGETELMALRTPLVTGVAGDDVAGSLTYYFDNRHTLRRLTFVGLTGDERRFANLIRQRFGLQAEPTLLAGEFAAPAGARQSRLRIAHLPVVRADAAHARAELALDLYRTAAPSATAAAQPTAPALRPPFRSW